MVVTDFAGIWILLVLYILIRFKVIFIGSNIDFYHALNIVFNRYIKIDIVQ